MNLLKAAREAAGMSKEALAVAARISYAYVCALESGARQAPNVRIGQRIAAAVGKTVADLWPMDDSAASA